MTSPSLPSRLGAFRRRADSLATRVVLAVAVLGLVVAVVIVVLVLAVADLRTATIREANAKDVVTDTVTLQKLVLDLETGLRGYVITGDRRFLGPWRAAQRELPAALESFVGQASADPREARVARRLEQLIEEYVRDYSIPLVAIAGDNPAAAGSGVADEEGRRRTDEIRELFAQFLATERGRARQAAAAAADRARSTVAIGIVGIAGSALLIALIGVYLARSIARPIREVAAGAARVAQGELGLELSERGPGEVGRLTRAFNEMARELVQRERALAEQNAQLRASERAKSELVSMVSHEIRTPLASILGFAAVLVEREVDEESRRRYLRIIRDEGKRLAVLLNDFLDVQRMEEGRLDLERRTVDVSALLRRQVELFSAQSEKHLLALSVPDEPLIVEGDGDRLAQIVANLLSNAIKYSPDGGRVTVAGENMDGEVRITVADEGIGIAAGEQDKVFTKFFRARSVSGIGGTGLGLALARAIAEAHGGRIGLDSRVGAGSTFSVDLPTKVET